MNELLKSAFFYKKNGLSVIATGENKRAIMPWKKFQTEIATDEELTQQFTHGKCKGIAVVCGSVSKGLEVIDIDLKYDITKDLWERLTDKLNFIIDKLYQVKTKSGGYHLYYFTEQIEGNQKLANRPATPEELKENPNVKSIVLIETRFFGGYVIAPPSEGYTKKNAFEIPIISIDEREQILSICRSFNEVFEEEKPRHKHTETNTFAKTPWDDYNDKCNAVELLERHGWSVVNTDKQRTIFKRPGNTDSKSSGDYHHELRLFKVFTTSSQFEPGKGYKPYALYTILEHNGDYSAAAKQLIKDGYGEQANSVEKKLSTKITRSLGAGHSFDRVAEILMTEEGKSKSEAEQLINDVIAGRGEIIQTFWTVNETKQGVTITIQRHKLIEFLFDNGFHLFFYDKNSNIYRIVRQNDGFVVEATTEMIKKFVKDYIQNLPAKFDSITPNELLEVVMKGSDSYFGSGMIEFLAKKDINLLKDDAKAAYFPFKNGIVRVDNKCSALVSYGEVNKAVWLSQVIDFNIDVDTDFAEELCEFWRFLQSIAGKDDEMLEYLLSLTGYLLHQYKDPARPFAVILAEQTEDERKGGGTGKGIFVKALSYMSNIERVDGKNFKLDKSFAFQRVGLDTKILAIEDVRKNVDFEGFYSVITEGITVEKKNKDELFIPYKDSPKVLFTTNYTLPSTGDHAKRRQRVFEFSNFFSATNTPLDFFGHKLFDDWDQDEWNRFYNLMFIAVTFYLKFGVKDIAVGEKMHRKHIRLNFGEEYLDWWDSFIKDEKGKWNDFKALYNSFLLSNDYDKKDFSSRKFKKAMDESVEKFAYKIQSRRYGHENINQIQVCDLI